MSWMHDKGMSPAYFREVRDLEGLTQKELAEWMGVAPNTLARWERGERSIPKIADSWIRLLVELRGMA